MPVAEKAMSSRLRDDELLIIVYVSCPCQVNVDHLYCLSDITDAINSDKVSFTSQ